MQLTSPGRSVGVQSRVPLPADKILADLHARGAHVIWACCVRLGRGLVLLLRPQGGGRRRVFRWEPSSDRSRDLYVQWRHEKRTTSTKCSLSLILLVQPKERRERGAHYYRPRTLYGLRPACTQVLTH